MRYFLTGTDTGVGKTYFTCWLVRAWLRAGLDAIALKPIATGDREDARALHEAMGGRLTLDEINPLHFREPLAPLVAARAEGREINVPQLNAEIRARCMRHSHAAVEGVGGWRVPLAPGYDVSDWARDLGWPVVVVARGRLGTLNHTLLTVESILAAGLNCAGVVLNPGADNSPDFDFVVGGNAAVLRERLTLPVFEFTNAVAAAGEIPAWLAGK
jgi:dethiobiotin synthetase